MNYANQVKRFLICLTSDVELAEELTQETFYQAVKSIDRYNGSCKMSVWLCQIAKHLYYDHLKKQKLNLSLEELSHVPITLCSKDKNPEQQFLHQEKMNTISKHINLLNTPYREIFLLRTMNYLSFREIGERFAKSENWARVTYYRTKLKLKERITGEKNEM